MPRSREMMRGTVLRAMRLSPHFVRVTLVFEQGVRMEPLGFDQAARLFFPREGQDALLLPTSSGAGWIPQFYRIPAASRPHVRNYTIRAYRSDARELDVEFAIHGGGPASTWAATVRPGGQAGILPEGIQYLPRDPARPQLLVGDESAVPAILAILDAAPRDLIAEVHLEVPHRDDVRSVAVPRGVSVRWLPRPSAEDRPGRLALDSVVQAHSALEAPYAFLAGESGMVTGIRRHLVSRGARADITFSGYWKVGRSSPG